ncbi:RNA polymerase factor sigma-54 [Martelella alba]|uniref:RNA polymerase sigma-54 factor n=1 Tax=Martelella alba TaxID=2590451 RepID=A0A506U419_9HYPH|nr:RNA polymerase factor sigma-54 [Martelella alba]TPW28076.1 RNA polymerase factor sigma-54 [Martelella alba]
MALSASLYLRQNQSLVMTPQLMQSIQLLQMTHLELTQFIAREIESNPLLETAPSDDGSGDGAADEQAHGETENDALSGDWYGDDNAASQAVLADQLDSNFSESYSDEGQGEQRQSSEAMSQWKSMTTGTSGDEPFDLDDFVASRPCLRDHLTDQIALTFRAHRSQAIARYLIDYLDEAGYFLTPLEEIAPRINVSVDDLKPVLTTLQTLDPPGIFATSLSDCLKRQLQQKDRLDPAMLGLVENLDLVARRDFTRLKKLCGVNDDDILDMIREVRALNPKPGSTYILQPPESVLPDVIVTKDLQDGWRVELNQDTLPRVLVNRDYLASIKTGGIMSDADQTFLNTCLQNANWLTRSLDQRARTILKVASEIVRQQEAFLKLGVDHLRPLTLKTVAAAIDMHESTVSRVTTNKFMLTPRGLFELKYFFTVSIGSTEDDGANRSAEAVRHRIRQLIAAETAETVLSDDDIVSTLKSEGTDLARRTVAKYREAMNIPSSVQRRREKRAMARVSGL